MGVVLHVLYWLVIIGVIIVFYRVASQVLRKQKPNKPKQLDDPSNFLVIERVSGEYQAEENEVGPIRLAHRDLLVAGDAVLARLSDSDLKTLSAPISEELQSRVLQGDIDKKYLTPQRVRAAVAVGEISMTLESLMVQFSPYGRTDTLFFLLFFVNGKSTEISIVGNKIDTVHIIESFARKIELDDWKYANYDEPEFDGYVAACRIWDAVVALLREGKVRIPGLRAS